MNERVYHLLLCVRSKFKLTIRADVTKYIEGRATVDIMFLWLHTFTLIPMYLHTLDRGSFVCPRPST